VKRYRAIEETVAKITPEEIKKLTDMQSQLVKDQIRLAANERGEISTEIDEFFSSLPEAIMCVQNTFLDEGSSEQELELLARIKERFKPDIQLFRKLSGYKTGPYWQLHISDSIIPNDNDSDNELMLNAMLLFPELGVTQPKITNGKKYCTYWKKWKERGGTLTNATKEILKQYFESSLTEFEMIGKIAPLIDIFPEILDDLLLDQNCLLERGKIKGILRRRPEKIEQLGQVAYHSNKTTRNIIHSLLDKMLFWETDFYDDLETHKKCLIGAIGKFKKEMNDMDEESKAQIAEEMLLYAYDPDLDVGGEDIRKELWSFLGESLNDIPKDILSCRKKILKRKSIANIKMLEKDGVKAEDRQLKIGINMTALNVLELLQSGKFQSIFDRTMDATAKDPLRPEHMKGSEYVSRRKAAEQFLGIQPSGRNADPALIYGAAIYTEEGEKFGPATSYGDSFIVLRDTKDVALSARDTFRATREDQFSPEDLGWAIERRRQINETFPGERRGPEDYVEVQIFGKGIQIGDVAEIHTRADASSPLGRLIAETANRAGVKLNIIYGYPKI
jgi:hypothetical protein